MSKPSSPSVLSSRHRRTVKERKLTILRKRHLLIATIYQGLKKFSLLYKRSTNLPQRSLLLGATNVGDLILLKCPLANRLAYRLGSLSYPWRLGQPSSVKQ
jgi:hypothetical protein